MISSHIFLDSDCINFKTVVFLAACWSIWTPLYNTYIKKFNQKLNRPSMMLNNILTIRLQPSTWSSCKANPQGSKTNVSKRNYDITLHCSEWPCQTLPAQVSIIARPLSSSLWRLSQNIPPNAKLISFLKLSWCPCWQFWPLRRWPVRNATVSDTNLAISC